MKIDNYILIFTLIFLTHCGFKPIYSTNKINFEINKIEYESNSLNKLIVSKLNFLKENKKAINFYNIKIDSKDQVYVLANDSKGDPTLFRMEINTVMTVFQNEKNIFFKKYNITFDYANNSKKFELKQYENEIKKNLLEQISENIIRDLYTIK